MNNSIRRIFIAFFIFFLTPILSYPLDKNAFQVRLVHPENGKIIEDKSLDNFEGYDKYTVEPPGWPTVIWVSGRVELDISDLDSASVKFTEPIVSKKVFNEVKKQYPDLESPNLEKAFTEGGQPQIEFKFNSKGARKLAELTTKHVNQRIGIFLEGKLLSAPKIINPMKEGKAQLTTPLSPEQAEKLVERINYLISITSEHK